MPSKSKTVGNRGESLAEEFLRKKNYEILAKQYRFRNGEIDIVAKTGTILVFVEVKTADLTYVSESPFGEPETWLTVTKQKFLRKSAEHYLWKNKIGEMDCRFDLIAVRIYSDHEEINHIENAFWM
ncbi:YraN family protein [bacterium]|nr:MAG: YraN family protein [bacterium]